MADEMHKFYECYIKVHLLMHQKHSLNMIPMLALLAYPDADYLDADSD